MRRDNRDVMCDFALMPSEREKLQAWLRGVIEASGLKNAAFARKAGLAASTINRFLNSQEATHTITTRTIWRICDTYKVKAPQLTAGDMGVWVEPVRPVLDSVRVVGVAEAGSWREAIEAEPEEQYPVSFPTPKNTKFSDARRYGLEVRGSSMDLEYPEGTIVVCVPLAETDWRLQNGDHVVVERTRRDGLREATIKEYRLDSAGNVWLWPRSSSPRYQQPIPVNDGTDDHNIESVEITGLVIGHYKHNY